MLLKWKESLTYGDGTGKFPPWFSKKFHRTLNLLNEEKDFIRKNNKGDISFRTGILRHSNPRHGDGSQSSAGAGPPQVEPAPEILKLNKNTWMTILNINEQKKAQRDPSIPEEV